MIKIQLNTVFFSSFVSAMAGRPYFCFISSVVAVSLIIGLAISGVVLIASEVAIGLSR